MSKLAEILNEIEAKANEVTALFNEADAQHNGEMADDVRGRVKALNQEIETLESRAVDLKGDEAIREANVRRVAELKVPATRLPFPGAAAGTPAEDRRSLGTVFTESKELQEWLRSFPNGQIPDSAKGLRSPAVSVKTLVTGASATSGGAFVVADQSGIYDNLGRKPLVLRDLISVRQTGSDAVEYVRMTSRTNNAAPVAEATATSDGTGLKPESAMAFLRVSTTVKTIANWVPATKRAISDASQLRGLIDDELRANLEETLEDQILNGDNTGENFEGLDTVSGTQDQAYDTDLLTTTRKARTLVRTVGRAIPTAYVMNPTDWQTIDLLKDNESRYFFGGPSQLGTPRLWGLPVVECESQTAGNAWVGDFKKIVLWDREQGTISVSDSHSDFFVRNLIAILAEMRAALGIIRPSAFVEVDLTP